MTNYAQLYCDLYLSLEDKKISHDQVVGWKILDENTFEILKLLATQSMVDESYECKKDGASGGSITLDRIRDKHFDGSISLEIKLYLNNLNSSSKYIVCHDWNNILKNENYLKNPIKELFFISTEKYLSDQSNDEKFNNYLNIHKILKFIDDLSESTNSWTNTIFYQRPIKFLICLEENDLSCNIDITALDKLLKKDLHQEAITNLICKEVVNFVKDIDEKQRLSHLIKHLSSLISNILLSYQSYVENYSFDQVRKEYLEKRTEYISKMNETFDSVATKMLAIPAAIWFATAQISNKIDSDFVSSKNIIVLITILFMVVILILNIWSHRNTLFSLKKEYEEVFKNLAIKFNEESTEILKVKQDLDSKLKVVKFKMYFSIFSSICLLIFTLILYWQANEIYITDYIFNAWQWIIDTWFHLIETVRISVKRD